MVNWAAVILLFVIASTEAYDPKKLRMYNINRNPGILFEDVERVYLQDEYLELIALINMNYIYNIHPYYQKRINAIPQLNQTIKDLKNWITGLEEMENFNSKFTGWLSVVRRSQKEGILVESKLNQDWAGLAKEMYAADHPVNIVSRVTNFWETLKDINNNEVPADLFTPEAWKNLSKVHPSIIKTKECDLTYNIKLLRASTEVIAIKIKIPQLQSTPYKIFKLHRPAIFTKIGEVNVTSQVKFRNDYMGINQFRNKTFFISEIELNNLPSCRNKLYFKKPPIYHSNPSCEAELFVYSKFRCEVVDTPAEEPFISQTRSGIVFSFGQPKYLAINCQNQVHTQMAKGLDVVDLPTQCELNVNGTIFKGTTVPPVTLVVQDAVLKIGNMSRFIRKPTTPKPSELPKPKLTPQYVLAYSFQYHVEILMVVMVVALLCNICLWIFACKRKRGKYIKVKAKQEMTEVVSNQANQE